MENGGRLMNFKYSLALILFMSCFLLSGALLSYTIDQKDQSLAETLLNKTFNDSEISAFVHMEGGKFVPGQLILIRKAPSAWVFGILQNKLRQDLYDVQGLGRPVFYKNVKAEAVRAVLPFWRYLYQPTQSLDQFNRVVDERLAYFKKNGAPNGHGMVIPAGCKIALLGDLHGSYSSLQHHLLEMHKEGLLDNNFKLRSNVYLVCLGDYAGFGPHSVEVFNTLLRLQQANQGRVFLLAGDHEVLLKGESDGFKKEFFEKFESQEKQDVVARSWQQLNKLCGMLPRVLLLGLQMPSTHNYDFLLFCHGCFEHSWRPQDFMKSIILHHIDNNYNSGQPLPYFHTSENTQAFVNGKFNQEQSGLKNKDDETSWTKNAFEDFVQRHASCIDPKYMYHSCLRAILRGHDHVTGGLVKLKDSGLKLWKKLKDKKTYEVDQASVYTCISGTQGITRFKTHDNAFALIEAGANGRWYITAHVEPV